MLVNVSGNVFKYGDNVDTDVIIPARYLNIMDRKELSAHCMEDLDRTFTEKVRPGDVIVGGNNFGCGSSREHAPMVIKECGIGAVIAKSFARIFYRNAVNIGLPIMECPEACQAIEAGDRVEIAFAEGKIWDRTRDLVFQAAPFPEFIQEIIRAGGLMNRIRASGGRS